ncbi:hypothetical protein MOF52_21375 [Bacillus inaquosorum]|uniref:hypothetical protein n=1 Tax=Bacillus inaquosorum TaxID=483913 RepID=UPI0022813356|nr:hypothetical protein [Bacillus inaquosorum]MCY8054428.1 hypothetical protein [Bacillus inaquosorum]MCY9410484.1 hypothetical protein [Bacillus inaquosorum]MCY9418079.1 hypothetical protein [Bacillus inaquosorum]
MKEIPAKHRELYFNKISEVYGRNDCQFQILAVGKRGVVGLTWSKKRVELVRMTLSSNEDEVSFSIDAKFDPEKIRSEYDRMFLLAKNLLETDYKSLIN